MDKLWLYVRTRRSYGDINELTATVIRNVDSTAPPTLRNLFWDAAFDGVEFRDYADLALRVQASPSDYAEPPGALIFYAYGCGVEDVGRPITLQRMERQIKVLRKFKKFSRYGEHCAEVNNLTQWIAAITHLADFLKVEGFVVPRSGGIDGSWSDVSDEDLVYFDTQAPLQIYRRIQYKLERDGYRFEGGWQ